MRAPMIRSAARGPVPIGRPSLQAPPTAAQRPRGSPTGAALGGPSPGPPLLARDVVDQDVLPQTLGGDEESPPLVDPGHLVHEFGQVRTALEHESVDDDPIPRAIPNLAQG